MSQSRVRMIDPADDRTEQEAALGRRLAGGDERAFDEVIRRYSADVQRLARRILGWRHAEAEDVAQDVFVQVFLKRAAFRGDSSLKTWLTRITVNRCRSVQRRKLLSLAGLWNILHPRQPAGPSGDEDTAHGVRAAVLRLPAREREVVVMYYLEEMPAAEVAAVLNLSATAMNVRLHRARKRLEHLLADYRGSEHA
jgi:RNA polymerase sigma factor (sigma-70 family)